MNHKDQPQPVMPPEPRLQMDIGPDSKDLQWWYEALKTRDDRLAWWKEATFGCFIHWGPYSVLGGVWRGKVWEGYTEHQQRKARITQEEYLHEVIEKFNPTDFDAEEWVSAFKKAGMRYLVVTAKHHDGFAMYDSTVSDYNLMKTTPYKKDPMAALKKACDRMGMRFGFYYSHAFDWGEADAPGNDWEYENPGGDKGLHGGLNWFDLHPEMVPRIRKYVDNKAIPQLKELIHRYSPDIMWFDTPQKLPPEENLRILKAVRQAKPDILVNRRVLAPYDGMPEIASPTNFGDYQNSGDRAVDFPSIAVEWETIPTTNESYGYSINDRTHKSPEMLLEVIAKAVARGGNILLNLGPRGDGSLDGADLEILKGIGQWIDMNEASIRNMDRTTLPVQPWGESTRKGDTFYLHVFNWPDDGLLEFGGFQGKIRKAWLMANPTQSPLKTERIDENTIILTVPCRHDGLGHAVIVVEVDDAMAVSDHRLVSSRTNNFLRAFDGLPVGGKFTFGDGKADNNIVKGWKGPDHTMTWPVYLCETGSFTVSVEYAPLETSEPFIVEIGGITLPATTRTDGGKRTFVRHEIGTVELPEGPHLLTIHPETTPQDDLMRLRAIHLNPVDCQRRHLKVEQRSDWSDEETHEN